MKISETLDYLDTKSSLGVKTIRWALIGILLLILCTIGICIGNIAIYTEYFGENVFLKQRGYETIYEYSYLISPSAFLGFIGLIAISPVIIKIIFRLIKRLWKIVKLVIYEVVFEATKAIEDAKKKKNE